MSEAVIVDAIRTPIGRAVKGTCIAGPDEAARVVSFLAQDASSYITGQIWGVNDGIDL